MLSETYFHEEITGFKQKYIRFAILIEPLLLTLDLHLFDKLNIRTIRMEPIKSILLFIVRMLFGYFGFCKMCHSQMSPKKQVIKTHKDYFNK